MNEPMFNFQSPMQSTINMDTTSPQTNYNSIIDLNTPQFSKIRKASPTEIKPFVKVNELFRKPQFTVTTKKPHIFTFERNAVREKR